MNYSFYENFLQKMLFHKAFLVYASKLVLECLNLFEGGLLSRKYIQGGPLQDL